MNRWARAAARGAVAGLRATLPMTGVMHAAQKVGVMGQLPPKKIATGLLARLGADDTGDAKKDAVSALTHLGFGAAMGAMFGLLREGGLMPQSVLTGVAFGTAIWAFSYAGWVPALGLMSPPQHDRAGRPAAMLAAHWVYGTLLERRTR